MRLFFSILLFAVALVCAVVANVNAYTGDSWHSILWSVAGIPFALGGLFFARRR